MALAGCMRFTQGWKINPNLDLPWIAYHRYSRRNLTGELAKILLKKKANQK